MIDRTDSWPFHYFKVKKQVGRGAHSQVFEANDEKQDRPVALKLLEPQGELSEEITQRFFQEARAVASVDHANVVRIYDYGEFENRPYISYELIIGRTLDKWKRAFEPKLRDICALLVQVCEGVSAAHKQGIVHRDLKPTNIMVDLCDKPVVIDFGLASIPDHRLTTSDVILGTVAYMAPEQAQGNSDNTDARSDVYSLGVIAMEMMAEKRPYETEKTAEYLACLCNRAIEPISAVDCSIPLDLACIIDRCLSREPADRYCNAGKLACDLQQFLDGKVTEARRQAQRSRFGHFLRRRLVLIVLAAGGLFLTIGFIRRIWESTPGERFRAPALGELKNAPTSSALRECSLVLAVHTSAEFDLEKIEKFVRRNPQSLLQPYGDYVQDPHESDAAPNSIESTGEWISWSLPLKSDFHGKYHQQSILAIEQIDASVFLAIHQFGVIQVGVKSTPAHHCLLFLTQGGIDNCSTFGRKEYLPDSWADQIKSVASPELVADARSSLLANWLSDVYAALKHDGSASNGPSNFYELYQCPFELRNYFKEEIGVVYGGGWHMQFDENQFRIRFADYKNNTRVLYQRLEQARNRRWSPIPDAESGQSDQDVRIEYHVELTLDVSDSNKHAALYLRASVDDEDKDDPKIRNAALFRAKGFSDFELDSAVYGEIASQFILDPDSPSDMSAFWTGDRICNQAGDLSYGGSFIELDSECGVLVGGGRKPRNAAMVHVVDLLPSQISLEVRSEYSVVHPEFRLAFFGSINQVESELRAFHLSKSKSKGDEILTRANPPLWNSFPPYQETGNAED